MKRSLNIKTSCGDGKTVRSCVQQTNEQLAGVIAFAALREAAFERVHRERLQDVAARFRQLLITLPGQKEVPAPVVLVHLAEKGCRFSSLNKMARINNM